MTSGVHLFGIRHHGPGSARSLLAALERLEPDCVLIEGPPEADELLPMVLDAEARPPLALLIYAVDHPSRATYYPMAHFSPEWVALRFAVERELPVRMMDLPQAIQFAITRHTEGAAEEEATGSEPPPTSPDPDPSDTADQGSGESDVRENELRGDPISWLARAAGYADGERWWDDMIETRQDPGTIFPAIADAMAVLRETADDLSIQLNSLDAETEALREAYMRTTIRATLKEGRSRIAVISGAWHTPALRDLSGARQDAALLRGKPKVKVAATWTPWTYERLSWESGYGAGIVSPGWYEHLWDHSDSATIRWMSRVARLLREADLDAGSASVIEAVRLAEALASVRERRLPGLDELNEAARSVFCLGNEAPIRLIRNRLIIGDRMGIVPAAAPVVPLQRDIQACQKKLRLKVSGETELLELDLRKPLDQERSRFLHRLSLLQIRWGELLWSTGTGTFRERWNLKWTPELTLAVVQAGVWGNQIEEAARCFLLDRVDRAAGVLDVVRLIDHALLADLPGVSDQLLTCLLNCAALQADVAPMLEAIPELVRAARYVNVRGTDQEALLLVAATLLTRCCIGLPGAAASLNTDAAQKLLGQIAGAHASLRTLDHPAMFDEWLRTLCSLADQPGVHALLAGRCVWFALDGGAFQQEDAARRLSASLSPGVPSAQAAHWLEGFLMGNAELLIHADGLLELIDEWVCGLTPDDFKNYLPLIRRTFSTFERAERRAVGEKLAATQRRRSRTDSQRTDLDPELVALTVQTLRTLLGIPETGPHE